MAGRHCGEGLRVEKEQYRRWWSTTAQGGNKP